MSMKGKNYMQIARALIRDLENLNRVSFGKGSCDIVFKHIQDRDNTWIADIEKLERQLFQLRDELNRANKILEVVLKERETLD